MASKYVFKEPLATVVVAKAEKSGKEVEPPALPTNDPRAALATAENI